MARNGKHGHRFDASGDFVERLEGSERREAIPPEDVVNRMGVSKMDTVVDLGAGIGYFTFPMAKLVKTVIAVDIEPKMVEILKRRLVERGVSNVKAFKAEITALPVESESVDHVLAAFVYHEVRLQKELMRECARLLRPGGRLTVVDFQKRETAFGPPVLERKTPESVERTAGKWFAQLSRFETDTYYQIMFEKK
jgi:ubiquinone/menaquinone biosynthesis C-methylase UbiE